MPPRGSVRRAGAGQVPEKLVGSQCCLGAAAARGGGLAPVWSDQSTCRVWTISITALPTNDVSASQKGLTRSFLGKQQGLLRVEMPTGSPLRCKGPSGVRDPWNGRIIYAHCVSRRGLAREGRVGGGPPPTQRSPSTAKGSSKQQLQDFWDLLSVCCCVPATILHLSGGQQGDRGEGNPERAEEAATKRPGQ